MAAVAQDGADGAAMQPPLDQPLSGRPFPYDRLHPFMYASEFVGTALRGIDRTSDRRLGAVLGQKSAAVGDMWATVPRVKGEHVEAKRNRPIMSVTAPARTPTTMVPRHGTTLLGPEEHCEASAEGKAWTAKVNNNQPRKPFPNRLGMGSTIRETKV